MSDLTFPLSDAQQTSYRNRPTSSVDLKRAGLPPPQQSNGSVHSPPQCGSFVGNMLKQHGLLRTKRANEMVSIRAGDHLYIVASVDVNRENEP
jgi:hypothetical protein